MKRINIACSVLVASMIFVANISSKEEEQGGVQHIKKGFFSLPVSQTIAPLYGIGQLVIGKGDKLVTLSTSSFQGDCESFTHIIPSFIYGIRDDLSLFIQVPIATKFKLENDISSGLGDISFQIEYAFYSTETITTAVTATIVGAISLPTGDALKNPPTGFGSPTFYLGPTVGYLEVNWYLYTSQGILITTERCGTKFGNTLTYQFGVARNIGDKPGWIFAVMLEMFGVYIQRSKIQGKIDQNSGGNTFFMAPSFWASSEHFIFQGGVAFAVAEHLFGQQRATLVHPIVDFGWTF